MPPACRTMPLGYESVGRRTGSRRIFSMTFLIHEGRTNCGALYSLGQMSTLPPLPHLLSTSPASHLGHRSIMLQPFAWPRRLFTWPLVSPCFPTCFLFYSTSRCISSWLPHASACCMFPHLALSGRCHNSQGSPGFSSPYFLLPMQTFTDDGRRHGVGNQPIHARVELSKGQAKI